MKAAQPFSSVPVSQKGPFSAITNNEVLSLPSPTTRSGKTGATESNKPFMRNRNEKERAALR